ncbi:MAG: hypothetical protein JJU36_01610 [Phycisphaeraceae bacterium]|nr:hypothetical protein [Phycisphaeraceae bacterium]
MVCLPRTLNAREVARWLGVGARTASRMLEVHRRAMSDLASDELAAQIDQTLVKEGGLWRPYVTSAVPSIDLTRWVKSGWPRGYAPDEFPDMSIAKPLRELVFKYARRHSPREEVFCEVITRILSAQESSDT